MPTNFEKAADNGIIMEMGGQANCCLVGRELKWGRYKSVWQAEILKLKTGYEKRFKTHTQTHLHTIQIECKIAGRD